MEAHLVGLERTGVALILILTIAGFLVVRRAWMMAGAGVVVAVAIAMLAATRFALWTVPALAGQVILVVAFITLTIAVVRARRRARGAGRVT